MVRGDRTNTDLPTARFNFTFIPSLMERIIEIVTALSEQSTHGLSLHRMYDGLDPSQPRARRLIYLQIPRVGTRNLYYHHGFPHQLIRFIKPTDEGRSDKHRSPEIIAVVLILKICQIFRICFSIGTVKVPIASKDCSRGTTTPGQFYFYKE